MDLARFADRVVAPCPPGWTFHLVVVPPALALLYALSFPGIAMVVAMLSIYFLVAAAVIWAIRLVRFLRGHSRGESTDRAVWFGLAPLGAALVATLLWVDAPLRVRWAMSRSAFERVALQVHHGESTREQRVPFGRVGLYRVDRVWKVPNGVIFFDDVGAFLDYAGFAYLPSGPSSDLESGSFENPEFQPIGGDWYTWNASW